MLDCNKYSIETLSDLQDDSLPFLTAWRVRHHIKWCSVCAGEWQQLQQLQTAAQNWHRTATLPAGQYPPPLPAREPLPLRRRPSLALRGAMLMGMVVTLTGGAFLAFNPLMTARPAFAEVEQATSTVRTAQWTTTVSVLDCRTGETNRYTTRKYARLLVPALRTESGSGFFEVDGYEIQTPGLILHVGPSAKYPNKRMAVLRPNRENDFRWPQESDNSQVRFQQRLINELLDQHSLVEQAKAKSIVWSVGQAGMSGRSIQRFDMGSGNEDQTQKDRLTKPGFHRTIWVDPTTHRIVRSRQEYYDGEHHSIVTNESFLYDQPLPDSLFSLKPPPDATLRR